MVVFQRRNLDSLFLSSTPSRFARSKSRNQAFSTLEIVGALAIFVFGVLAVIRIFPSAVQSIAIGDRQNAADLNHVVLARIQNEPPLAIYDTQEGSDWTWQDGSLTNGVYEPRAMMSTARRSDSLPQSDDDFSHSALGSLRAIIGESDTVQQEGDGHLFVLTQFPIFGDSQTPTQVRIWKREALSNVTINERGYLNLSKALVASTNEPFAPPSGALYYVSFRYRDNDNIWGVDDAPTTKARPVVAPDAAPSEMVRPNKRIVKGSVEATCAHLLGTVSANDEGDNKRGEVDLDTMGVKSGEQVYVDYQADWGWMMQSGMPDSVPDQRPHGSAKPRQIALGAPYVEASPTHPIFVLAQKRKGGKLQCSEDAWDGSRRSTNSHVSYPPTQSDLRMGRLTFELGHLGKDETFAGSRVTFRTHAGWSQQISVAASTYKPYGCGLSTPSYLQAGEPWRDYALDAPNAVLYFHSSEAGKSVLVTYSYNEGGTDVTLRDRLLTIEDNEQPTDLPVGFAPSGYAAPLQLTDMNGDDLTPGSLRFISGVRGASLSVRTAWQDGKHYTQSFLTAMRLGAGAEAMP